MATGTIELASIRDANYRRGTEIPNAADLNDYTSPGLFFCPSGTRASTLINCPVETNFRLEVYMCGSANETGSLYRTQIIRTTLSSEGLMYMRNIFNNAWGAWKRVVVDSDLSEYVHFVSTNLSGAVSITKFAVESNSSQVLDVPGNYSHGVLFSTGGSTNVDGIAYIRTGSSGNVSVSVSSGFSSVTFDTSVANKITVNNGSGYWGYMLYIHY